MLDASFISTINVDSPNDILSEAPTRVNILSTNPILAESAGTKLPICAMIVMSAVWRSSADLPDMLGPVMMIICWLSLSIYTSLAMNGSSGGSCISITGWRPLLMSSSSDVLISGRMYLLSWATFAKEYKQSHLAIMFAFIWMVGIYSIKLSTSELNISASSEYIFSSAPNIFSSYSFNSCVMYLSALTRVCFLIHSAGTLSLCVWRTSM